MNNTEWKIAKSAFQCKTCGEKFAPGAAFFSALLEAGAGFERSDFCPRCFQERRPERVYSYWKTMAPDGDAEAQSRPVVDLDSVLDFFRRLAGERDPRRQAFRFVLALMLARKKALKLEGPARGADGGETLVFVERRGGERHAVVQPALAEEELAAVGEELGRLLGLAPPAAAQPPAFAQGTASAPAAPVAPAAPAT